MLVALGGRLCGGVKFIKKYQILILGGSDCLLILSRVSVLKKFLDGLPARFEVAAGDIQMNAVLIENMLQT